MQGRNPILAALILLLGLLGLGTAARAQSTFTVMPDPPNVADRPLFTYVATTPPGQCHPDFAPVPQIAGSEIVFQGTPSSSPVTPECSGSWLTDWQIDPLPVGTYVARVKVGADEVASLVFDVVVSNPPPPVPPLTVDPAHPTTRDSADGPGFAVPLTDRSGYFWFFDSGNIEVTVKILDGRAVNGHFWLFAASMTDVPFTLYVTDPEGPNCFPISGGVCLPKTYTSTAGKNENFIDIGSL